jgi:hypothetical protein
VAQGRQAWCGSAGPRSPSTSYATASQVFSSLHSACPSLATAWRHHTNRKCLCSRQMLAPKGAAQRHACMMFSPCRPPCHQHAVACHESLTGSTSSPLARGVISCCALCRRAERQARIGARLRHRRGRPGSSAAGCAGAHGLNKSFKCSALVCFSDMSAASGSSG